MEEEKGELLRSLIDAVNQIAPIGDYRCAVKKEFCNLARRLKLLTPMFEEIRESKEQIPEETVKALVSLKEALVSAKELLRFGSEGSKIYLTYYCLLCFRRFFEVVKLRVNGGKRGEMERERSREVVLGTSSIPNIWILSFLP